MQIPAHFSAQLNMELFSTDVTLFADGFDGG
jgi:hypothetical protein